MLFFIHIVVCNNGDIRLIGGTNDREGRVEICDSQAWGTVCDDFWDSTDAGVACVQLGYQRTGTVYSHNPNPLQISGHNNLHVPYIYLQEQLRSVMPSLAKALVEFFLITWAVLELRLD